MMIIKEEENFKSRWVVYLDRSGEFFFFDTIGVFNKDSLFNFFKNSFKLNILCVGFIGNTA